MKEEFNLSEKRTENYLLLTSMPPQKTFCYREEDVKEAVRLLKELIYLEELANENYIIKMIDKIFGDKLI